MFDPKALERRSRVILALWLLCLGLAVATLISLWWAPLASAPGQGQSPVLILNSPNDPNLFVAHALDYQRSSPLAAIYSARLTGTSSQ